MEEQRHLISACSPLLTLNRDCNHCSALTTEYKIQKNTQIQIHKIHKYKYTHAKNHTFCSLTIAHNCNHCSALTLTTEIHNQHTAHSSIYIWQWSQRGAYIQGVPVISISAWDSTEHSAALHWVWGCNELRAIY